METIHIKGIVEWLDTYQNEKKGTSVAILRGVDHDIEREVQRRLGNNNYYILCEKMPVEIRAKTTLSEGDTWDAEYGKSRATKKVLVTRSKLVKNGIKNLIHRLIKDAIQLDKDEAYQFMSEELSKKEK